MAVDLYGDWKSWKGELKASILKEIYLILMSFWRISAFVLNDVVDCLWSLRILCFGEVWGVNKNTREMADQSPSGNSPRSSFHIVRTTNGSATRPRHSQPNLS